MSGTGTSTETEGSLAVAEAWMAWGEGTANGKGVSF